MVLNHIYQVNKNEAAIIMPILSSWIYIHKSNIDGFSGHKYTEHPLEVYQEIPGLVLEWGDQSSYK